MSLLAVDWPEAEIVADPVKNIDEPRVLVRRRISDLIGSRDEQLIYLPGEPGVEPNVISAD